MRESLLQGLLAVGAFVVWALIGITRQRQKEQRLFGDRVYPMAEFMAHFDLLAVAPAVSRSAYEFFQAQMATRSFQVHPDDRIGVYGINVRGGVSLYEAFDEVMSRETYRGFRKMPDGEIPDDPLVTVADFVVFVDWATRRVTDPLFG